MNRKLSFFLITGIILTGLLGISTTQTDDFEVEKNLEIFSNMYKELNTYYVDEIVPEKFIHTGIDAMLKSLDPYTNYIPAEEVALFRTQLTGKYGGIGAIIRTLKERVLVVEPYEGFPAYEAGMRAGDELLEANGVSLKGKNSKEVSNLLKGAPGTQLSLIVRRPGTEEPLNLRLKRSEVRVDNVPYYGMINAHTAYIYLNTFSENAGKNVGRALEELQDENRVEQIILDLRGNSGGLLMEAVNVANVFLPKNELIVQMRGREAEQTRSFSTLNRPVDTETPLVVLISRGSASASEIVAGALQDLDRAILVGQRSFGKGLVQNTRDVGFGTKVKMTTAKYYIPSGRCIQATEYDDGKPVIIDDSLRSAFRTRNGRTVLDGGGVSPDLQTEPDSLSDVSKTLSQQNLIFDYATAYSLKHEGIDPPRKFTLSDAEYDDFLAYLKRQNFDYTTPTEHIIDQLEKNAKEEHYYKILEKDLKLTRAEIEREKMEDLKRYKAEIKRILEQEIAARYFLREGRIEANMDEDIDIQRALKLFDDKKAYQTLLSTL